MILAVGCLVALVCLALQALASMIAARYFAYTAHQPLGRWPMVSIFLQFSVLMIVLMLGNVVQIAIWAALYSAVSALDDFETAIYFSGVTFTTLGYGDVVLKHHMRLLAPLQAANGVMMLGITSAAFVAAVQQTVERRKADLRRRRSFHRLRRGPP